MLKKLKKNVYFCIFLMQNDICRYFPIFSPLLPISFIPDPRQYIRRHDICNFGWNPYNLCVFPNAWNSIKCSWWFAKYVPKVCNHCIPNTTSIPPSGTAKKYDSKLYYCICNLTLWHLLTINLLAICYHNRDVRY